MLPKSRYSTILIFNCRYEEKPPKPLEQWGTKTRARVFISTEVEIHLKLRIRHSE